MSSTSKACNQPDNTDNCSLAIETIPAEKVVSVSGAMLF